MLMCSPTRRLGPPARRQGAAATEFAVCSLFLMVLVAGLQEICQAIRIKQTLNDAARRAARIGALPGVSTAAAQQAGVNVLADVFGNGSAAASSANVSMFLIPRPGGGNPWVSAPNPNNSTTADISTAKGGDAICAMVSVPVEQTMWITGWFFANTNGGVFSEVVIMLRQG